MNKTQTLVSAIGFRRLARDVEQVDDPPTDSRTVGKTTVRVKPEDDNLDDGWYEAVVGKTTKVPLDQLLSRFRRERLHEE
jgi:hypothetical protein